MQYSYYGFKNRPDKTTNSADVIGNVSRRVSYDMEFADKFGAKCKKRGLIEVWVYENDEYLFCIDCA
jgi:hypothetical protein